MSMTEIEYQIVSMKESMYLVWSEDISPDVRHSFYCDNYAPVQHTDTTPNEWISYGWKLQPNFSYLTQIVCAECDKPSGYDYLCPNCRQLAYSINGN